jgi:ATP-dependent RNA helicase RhlE
MRFETLIDDPRLLRTIAAMGFDAPREIQEKTLPAALEGRDLVALAPTGTGKTVAFGVPMARALLEHRPNRSGRRVDPRTRLRALVVCPTRELAMQVAAELDRLLKGLVPTVAVVTGKSALGPQREALARGVDLLVGTPGRIRELVERDDLSLAFVRQVVVDEADRMLDLGFMPQVRWILERTAPLPQRMLFSATMPREVEHLVDAFLKDPIRVEVGARNAAATNLSHRLVSVDEAAKVPTLIAELGPTPKGVLVFSRTRRRVGWIAEALRRQGLKCGMLHGDRTPRQRASALGGFVDGRLGVLVATDVAARGLHVPGIELVVNYDLPLSPEEWVHRVGRAGHGGGSGRSISFQTDRDGPRWNAIAQLAGLGLSAEPSSIKAEAPVRKPRRKTPPESVAGHTSSTRRSGGQRDATARREETRDEGRGRREAKGGAAGKRRGRGKGDATPMRSIRRGSGVRRLGEDA